MKYEAIQKLTRKDEVATRAFFYLQQVKSLDEKAYKQMYKQLCNSIRRDIGINKVIGLGVGLQKKVKEDRLIALVLVFDIECTPELEDFIPEIHEGPNDTYYIHYNGPLEKSK